MNNTSTNQPYLTVRDLIEMLQQKPMDAKVSVRIKEYAGGGKVTIANHSAFASGISQKNESVGQVVEISAEF